MDICDLVCFLLCHVAVLNKECTRKKRRKIDSKQTKSRTLTFIRVPSTKYHLLGEKHIKHLFMTLVDFKATHKAFNLKPWRQR